MDTSLEDFLKEIDANRKSFLEELEELVEPVICDLDDHYWVAKDNPSHAIYK